MDYFISDKIIFTEGYKNAAIYDLKNKKVYSINDIGRDIINRVIVHGELPKSGEESSYIDSLKANSLYSEKFSVEKYTINPLKDIKLDFAWLEITQACNLKCLHCYTGETHRQSAKPLLIDDWYNVINQLSDVGCKNIQFIGGEPCVYPRLIDLIEYAGSNKFDSITLFTNATIMTDEIIG